MSEIKPFDLDKIETIVGLDTKFNGEISSSVSIRIDGEFTGNINLGGDLYTGENAKIFADVHCRNIFHCGYLKGDVVATGQVELASKAKLIGNSTMASLITEEGSEIIGSCKTLTIPVINKES